MRSLKLNDNHLTALPPEFGNLAALKYLYLHNNPPSGTLPTFLTSLTALRYFAFYATDWCVPATGAVPAWLAGISDVYGTGQVCEQAPSKLHGTVTLADTTPAMGIQVNLYRRVSSSRWQNVTTTHTLSDGSYQLDGLGPDIKYYAWFVDPTHTYAPEYYNDQPTLWWATPITITLGMTRTGIDAVLKRPPPPAASIETSGSVTHDPVDGIAIISLPPSNTMDITVTHVVTCASGSPTSVTLKLGPFGPAYPMIADSADQYQATIPGAAITYDVDITVWATCGETSTESIIGYIYPYASGTVRDAITGEPIVDATVTLHRVPNWEAKISPDDNRPNTCESNRSKDEGIPWSQPAPTDLGVIVNPDISRVRPHITYQQTGSEGHYGWNVNPNDCWYVTVVAENYVPFTSSVVSVLPAVTDLNLTLTSTLLVFRKQADPVDNLRNNDPLTYTLTLLGPVWEARVWDPLPSLVRYIAGSITGTVTPTAVYSPTAHAVVWQGKVPTDTVQTIQFRVTPGITGSLSMSMPIVNTAWLTATESGRGVSATVIVNGHYLYLPLMLRDD